MFPENFNDMPYSLDNINISSGATHRKKQGARLQLADTDVGVFRDGSRILDVYHPVSCVS